MSIDAISGSSAASLPLLANNTHVATHGDSLGSIAQQYNVSQSDLQKINPHVPNPDVVYPGTHINVPDASASAAAPPDNDPTSVTINGKEQKIGTDANGASRQRSSTGTVTDTSVEGSVTDQKKTVSTNSRGTQTNEGEKDKFSFGIDHDKGSVSGSYGKEFSEKIKTAKGYGVSFSSAGDGKFEAGKTTKDGVTTYSVSGDVSLTYKFGGTIKKFDADFSRTDGIKAAYSVAMPEQAAKNTNLLSVNPFDPSSMPVGAKVSMDGSRYHNTELEASFRHMAIQTKVKSEDGVGVVVEKTGPNAVRVTAGPKQALENYNGIGVDFDKAKIMLGRTDKLSNSELKSAQYDLSTPQGRAAYNDYLVNGNLPSVNAHGVSDVSTTSKIDASSQPNIELKLGPLSKTFEGARASINSTLTQYGDGTKDLNLHFDYSHGVPMDISAKFDAAGNENLADRRYEFHYSKVDGETARHLSIAYDGPDRPAAARSVQAGDDVTISYTEAEMKTLMKETQSLVKAGVRPSIQDWPRSFTTNDYSDRAGFHDDPLTFATRMVSPGIPLGAQGMSSFLDDVARGATATQSPRGPDYAPTLHDYTALPGLLTSNVLKIDRDNGPVLTPQPFGGGLRYSQPLS